MPIVHTMTRQRSRDVAFRCGPENHSSYPPSPLSTTTLASSAHAQLPHPMHPRNVFSEATSARDPLGEMDHDDHLPHAHVVTEAGPLPPAAVVTGCIESGDRRCQNDAILVIETARRLPETTCIMPFILTAGVLLLLVALVQALLASNVKKKVSRKQVQHVIHRCEFKYVLLCGSYNRLDTRGFEVESLSGLRWNLIFMSMSLWRRIRRNHQYGRIFQRGRKTTACLFVRDSSASSAIVCLASSNYAGNMIRQGIKVLDSWAFGSYPTAGDPSIGFAGLSIGALFVFISLLAIFADGTQRCIPVAAAICAVLSSLGLFVKSFGELAGEVLCLRPPLC